MRLPSSLLPIGEKKIGSRFAKIFLLLTLAMGNEVSDRAKGNPRGETKPRLAPTVHKSNLVSSDTTFVARMKPIVIVGKRLDQNEPAQNESPRNAVVSGSSGKQSQTSARPRDGVSEGVTGGGFVMNETFSVVGNDFYTAFYGAWSEPNETFLYTVRVREEPAPQFGARLSVEISDTVIYRTFLRPNPQKIQKAARQAAQRAQVYLKKYYEPREVY